MKWLVFGEESESVHEKITEVDDDHNDSFTGMDIIQSVILDSEKFPVSYFRS